MLRVDESGTGQPRAQPRVDELGQVMSMDDVDPGLAEETVESGNQPPVEARPTPQDMEGDAGLGQLLGEGSSEVHGTDGGAEDLGVYSA